MSANVSITKFSMMPVHADVRTLVPTIYGNLPEKFATVWTAIIDQSQSKFGTAISAVQVPVQDAVDILTVTIDLSFAHLYLGFLKNEMGFTFLTDMTATDESVDAAAGSPRFLLVFHLFHLESKARVRIKIPVQENQSVETFIPLWDGANWAEREIFDMFGIRFDGHPDLRRILMDTRFEGHPLRKDYPLRGYQVFLTPEPLDPELLK